MHHVSLIQDNPWSCFAVLQMHGCCHKECTDPTVPLIKNATRIGKIGFVSCVMPQLIPYPLNQVSAGTDTEVTCWVGVSQFVTFTQHVTAAGPCLILLSV